MGFWPRVVRSVTGERGIRNPLGRGVIHALFRGLNPLPIPIMKVHRATIIAARALGFLTLGWVYIAVTGLQWLLHIHKLHMLIPRSTFTFDYNFYLACNVAYLAAAIAASVVLIFMPGRLLVALTPSSGRKVPVSLFWTSAGVIFGLILCLLGVHSILSTAMWTVYQSGTDSGWQLDLIVAALVAAGGVALCRKMLVCPRSAGML
jgi:hypothetical protein